MLILALFSHFGGPPDDTLGRHSFLQFSNQTDRRTRPAGDRIRRQGAWADDEIDRKRALQAAGGALWALSPAERHVVV